MRMFIASFLLVALADCTSSSKPPANLNFSSIEKSSLGYAIEFYSDMDIESLFSTERTRKIVARSLVCALENDHDFSVEHNIERAFRGGVELQGSELRGTKKQYRYLSEGNFFYSFNNGSQQAPLEKDEVIKLLAEKSVIECRIVMTIYFSKPYFSGSMMIPARDVVALLKISRDLFPVCPKAARVC